MPYAPDPQDTSHVNLSPEIQLLVERLAENAHDVWAKQRFREGWRFGPERNDVKKEHPNLVPYRQLTESEKEYDRATAMGSIKVLLALGYSITPPGIDPSEPSEHLQRIAAETVRMEALRRKRAPVAELISHWESRDRNLWASAPELHALLGERLINMGELLGAYDILQEGVKHHPTHVRLRQLLALALARSGSAKAANERLVELQREGHVDPESAGILARTQKDLFEQAVDEREKRDHLARAFSIYEEAFQRTKDYYNGINAAAMAVLLGKSDRAAEIAHEVRDICQRIVEASEDNEEYWPLATLGEATLIVGDVSDAEQWYARAGRAAGKRHGDLQSTRRNAVLLAPHVKASRERIERWFHIPRVVVFSGHMIDQPGRSSPRFPPEKEGEVRGQIRQWLNATGTVSGYASAACGADIIFAEVLLAQGGDVYIVLPYEKERFLADSVDIIPGANWRQRCEAVLKRATEVTVASDRFLTPGGVEYEYANLFLLGLARVRARQLGTSVAGLAVWDRKPGPGGGTDSAIQRWRQLGLDVSIIGLDAGPTEELHLPAVSSAPFQNPDIRGLLFADAVGFSKLLAEQVPLFVEHFLGLVGKIAASYDPAMKATWGDGLYFVFDTARATGNFALELCERVAAMDWETLGLPKLNLRIGVHAGPVYPCTDPVTERKNYIGTHVSRAARIEPIAPPGCVYASDAFAALAAVEGVCEFSCDYVGVLGMAKNYGAFRTYLVRPMGPK